MPLVSAIGGRRGRLSVGVRCSGVGEQDAGLRSWPCEGKQGYCRWCIVVENSPRRILVQLVIAVASDDDALRVGGRLCVVAYVLATYPTPESLVIAFQSGCSFCNLVRMFL